MRGPFGGALEAETALAREAAPARVVELFAPASEPTEAAGSDLVVLVHAKDGALVHAGDLRERAPLEPAKDRPLDEALAPLVDVARALEALHAKGRAHGDLRPAHVWVRGANARLTVPGKAIAAPVLLRTRIALGAPLEDVAFVAPEVLRGGDATPAADAYALAAIVAWRVTGQAPHGWPAALDARVPRDLRTALERGLAHEPEARPPISWLRDELERALTPVAAAIPVTDAGAASAGVLRVKLVTGPGAPAPAAPGPREERATTSLALVLLLVVGAIFTLAGALWLVAMTWNEMPEIGRAGLLFTLIAGVGGLGVRLEAKGFARSGFACLALATQLLWAGGAYLLVIWHQEDEPGAWTLVGAAITAVTYGLALRRGSAVLSILGTVSSVIALACLGAFLGSGTREGPAIFLLAGALAFAGLAALGQRVVGLAVGLAPALVGTLWLLGSCAVSLDLLVDRWQQPANVAFALGWGYGMVGLALGAGWLLRRGGAPGAYRGVATATGLLLIAFLPLVHALLRSKELVYLNAATAIGGGLVVLAFRWERLASDPARQIGVELAGLVSLAVPTGILALVHLADRDADALALASLSLSPAERLESPLFYLPYLVVTATVLVGLGLLFSRDAERKAPYRVLEGAGLLLFFGTLTILSLARHREWLHPLVLVGGGLAALGVGAQKRHLLLLVTSAGFLVLQVWIQYFAKLSQADVPLGLLLIGFGLGILTGGIVFEKKVRPRLGHLASWA